MLTRIPTASKLNVIMKLNLLALMCFVVLAENCFAQHEEDFLRQMQFAAVETEKADWGHWGDRKAKYSSWTYHSNRLVPIYTFGMKLDKYTGENSSYRSEELVREIYGVVPRKTVNTRANYMDQTEVYYLQREAFESGKKNVILLVFDGMDWQTSQAAAIYKNRKVIYKKGYGKGLAFLDYNECEKDSGDFVCSPHNSGTKTDVDAQTVSNIGGDKRGGYSANHGGYRSWSKPRSPTYLLGKLNSLNHVVTDSASSATSMNTGYKTYNSAINVAPDGTKLVPLARDLQQQGVKVGIVSSVPFSHATPATTYANNVTRNDYQDLSRDMLGLPSIANRKPLSGMDVVIGCGFGEMNEDDRKKQGENFVPGNKYLADDDLEKIDVENGGKYVVAQRTSGKSGRSVLRKAARSAARNDHRLFGFFGHAGGHLPYQTADGKYDPTRGVKRADRYTEQELKENPTLADMTSEALRVLSKGEKGFWLMIEAGDVDWASHNNNIDDSIGALFSGEAAFKAVARWIEKNSSWEESAVIVTADHGHFLVIEDLAALTGRNRETVEADRSANK